MLNIKQTGRKTATVSKDGEQIGKIVPGGADLGVAFQSTAGPNGGPTLSDNEYEQISGMLRTLGEEGDGDE